MNTNALRILATAAKCMIPLQFVGVAMIAQPLGAQTAPPTSSYPKLRMERAEGGLLLPATWQQMGEDLWVAKPGDPQSPRHIVITTHGTSMTPGKGLELAEEAFKFSASSVSTVELETFHRVSNGGKSWVTVANFTNEGVPHKVFVWTYFVSDKSKYETAVFTFPEKVYRSWGGINLMLENMELAKYLTDVKGLNREPGASNVDQAKVFAYAFDMGVLKIYMASQGANASSGALETLQAIGRDLQLQGECYMIDRCTYTHGALPGTGSTTYDPY